MLTYHLTVFSSYNIQAAIGILDHKVSSEISSEPSIIRPSDTMDESLRCLLLVVQISSSYDWTLDQQLTNTANRNETVAIIWFHDPSMATDGKSNIFGITIRSHPSIGDGSHGTLAGTLIEE
jgi:hypothetical protein